MNHNLDELICSCDKAIGEGFTKAKDPNDIAFLYYQRNRLHELGAKMLHLLSPQESIITRLDRDKAFRELSYYIIEHLDEIELDDLSQTQSANPVCVPVGRDGLLKCSLALKFSDSKEKLEEERKNANYIRQILTSPCYKGKFVPFSADFIKVNEKVKKRLRGRGLLKCDYVFPMQLIYSSKTLEGKIHEKRKLPFEYLEKDLERIVDFLALIHAYMPHCNQYNFNWDRDHVIKGLEGLGIKGQEQQKMVDNLLRFLEDFVKQNMSSLIFYKDAHPKNWIITPHDAIDAIDFENRGVSFPEYDLIRLLHDAPIHELNFSINESNLKKVEKLFSCYWKAKRNYGRVTSLDIIDESIVRYLNLFPLRSLLGLRLPQRTFEYKCFLNEMAKKSLCILKENYSSRYSPAVCFSDNLKRIEEALDKKIKERNVNKRL